MSEKLRIIEIFKAHIGTFGGYRRGTVVRDGLTFIGMPVVLSALAVVLAPRVYNVIPIVTGITIFTALLISVLVAVFNFAVKLRRDEQLENGHQLVKATDELFVNTAWTVVAGLGTAGVVLVVAALQVPSCPMPLWGVAITVGLVSHLALNVLMVLTRLWNVSQKIKMLPRRG